MLFRSNDGVVTVTMSGNHPDTQKNSWDCHASTAISATDSSVNYAAYDTDGDGELSVTELQVIFLVAGGESAGIIKQIALWCFRNKLPGGWLR